jgi:hypothetical protein
MADNKQAQVADQCRCVAGLCRAIAAVHQDYATLFNEGRMEDVADQIGNRTAALMEELGNILNGMDAVDGADEWMDPIFAEAHRMFPQSS